jgi:hypothetical protein
MRKKRGAALVVFGGGVATVGLLSLVQCMSDEETSVDIATSCDVQKLRTDLPEVTVRLFVETSDQLNAKVTDLQARFTAVCNKINKEAGETESPDIRGACNKIASRLAKAQALAPVPDGGTAPIWVKLGFSEGVCSADTSAVAACLTQCGGTPCDVLKGCPPERLSGTCAGNCSVCNDVGEAVACTGDCRGSCGTPDGGAACAAAECVGGCSAATWTGTCEQGCDLGFFGICGGTCTGTCDGVAIGDAGTPPAPQDAGAEAGEGGAPVDAGPTPPAPGGADGNCGGKCSGTCSAKASGSCRIRCRGGFSGGECTGGPARCTGTCSAASVGCTTTCRGSCSSNIPNGGTCAGRCTGTCSVPLTNPQCDTDLNCEGNLQCKNICRVKGALGTKCTSPTGVEVRLAGDLALYNALKNHLAEFGALSVEANLLNTASFSIGNVTLGDYKEVGATRDRARVCIQAAAKTVETARTNLATTVAASQVIRGVTF